MFFLKFDVKTLLIYDISIKINGSLRNDIMPKVTEQDIKKQLSSKEYSNIYYICGEEKMLVKHYNDTLLKKIMGSNPSDFNCHILSGENTIDDIAVAAYVVPFMEQYNYVAVVDLDLCNLDENQCTKFEELIGTVPDTTILVFTELTITPSGKQTAKRTRLLKDVIKKGSFLELKKLAPTDLKKQLIGWAKKRDVVLSPQNAEIIINYNGTDLQSLQNELNKLCAYVSTGEISFKDIEKLVTKNLEAKIFSLAELVIRGDLQNAFTQLDILFFQKEDPIAVLAVLSFTFGDMYRVKVAIANGHKSLELINKFDYTEGNKFRLQKAERLAQRLSINALRGCMELLKEADLALKSTSEETHRIILEKLIAKLTLASKKE